MIRVLFSLAALVLILGLAAPAEARPLKVVATFTILADMVHQVAGDAAEVTSIVGPDGDTHVFEPNPAAIMTVARADLVVANGLGLEPWLGRLIQVSGYQGKVVTATDGIVPLMAGAGRVPDPHAWQDLANGRRYVATIAAALEAAGPDHAAQFRAKAEAYSRRLAELDARVRAEISHVPERQRRIITSHDAFAYFGKAYGIAMLAPEGLSTDAEPTAGDLARLARQMEADKVKAVFLENMTDPRLVEALAHDAGAVIGGTLYSDALSPPDGPAPTYEAMFRHNVTMLVAAMMRN